MSIFFNVFMISIFLNIIFLIKKYLKTVFKNDNYVKYHPVLTVMELL